MNQENIWQWDSERQQYYYADRQRNEHVYQTGDRRPQTTQDDQVRWSSSNQTSLGAQSSVHQQSRRHHRDFSQGDQSLYTLQTAGPQAAGDRITRLIALLDANDLSFGVKNVQSSQGSQVQIYDSVSSGVQVRATLDPNTALQSAFLTGPANLSLGIETRRLLLPTPGESERLDMSYRIPRSGSEFFVEGKVFLALWVEPAGGDARDSSHRAAGEEFAEDAEAPTGQSKFSKVKRFVVIRERTNHCIALPIVNYGKQGVGHPNFNKDEHAIIHTSREPPEPMSTESPNRNELGMRPLSIRVVPYSREDALDPRSRLDFGKLYAIHHKLKVKAFGAVHEESLNALKSQFQNVFHSQSARTSGTGRVGSSSASSSREAGPPVQSRDRPPSANPPTSGTPPVVPRGTGSSVRNKSRNESLVDQDSVPLVRAYTARGGRSGTTIVHSQRSSRQVNHQEAMQTYNAYQRLMSQGSTSERALQIIGQALRRQQTTLSEAEAREIIRDRMRYIRTLQVQQSTSGAATAHPSTQGSIPTDDESSSEEESDDEAVYSGDDA